MHATKIGFLALEALINGAAVHSEFLQFIEVNIAFCHDSAGVVESFLGYHLDAKLEHLLLEHALLDQLLGEDRHGVVDAHFLLAAGAVKISERDLGSCPSVHSNHAMDAIRVENMSAGQAYVSFLAELTRVANAT